MKTSRGILRITFLTLAIAGCGDGADRAHGGEPDGETSTIDEASTMGGGQTTSVTLAEARVEPVQSRVFGEGTARALRREFLSFESAGRIAYVDPELKEGDRVSEGHVIAYQRPDRAAAELSGAEARLVEARTQLAVAEATERESGAALTLAQRDAERYERLLRQRSVAEQQVDDARGRLSQAQAASERSKRQVAAAEAGIAAAEADLARAKIGVTESRLVAPMDGLVARLNIEQGYYFSPQVVQASSEQGALDTVPVVLIDPGAHEITVDLPAYESGRVAVGAEVLIDVGVLEAVPASSAPWQDGADEADAATLPLVGDTDGAVRGTVYSVSPSLDPVTRTFGVKVRTADGDGRLRDGQFVTLWIAGPAEEDALTIPLGAARFDAGRPYVFVYDPEEESVARTDIALGLHDERRQQVLDGLEEGQRIVAEGRASVADGERVRVIERREATDRPTSRQP